MIKSYELEKNLKHFEILVKQSHTEIDTISLVSAGNIQIAYNDDTFSMIGFSEKTDELAIYSLIIEDILGRYIQPMI